MSQTQTAPSDATIADLNAVVPCQWLRPCMAVATWALVNSCCGLVSTLCEPHKRQNEAFLQEILNEGDAYECLRCRAVNSAYTWRLL